jgi:hypothetical protein
MMAWTLTLGSFAIGLGDHTPLGRGLIAPERRLDVALVSRAVRLDGTVDVAAPIRVQQSPSRRSSAATLATLTTYGLVEVAIHEARRSSLVGLTIGLVPQDGGAHES